METCLAMTIFREEFNIKFVVMFVSLLFVKIFHWLCGRSLHSLTSKLNLSLLCPFPLNLS
jgi:hypothetical protein